MSPVPEKHLYSPHLSVLPKGGLQTELPRVMFRLRPAQSTQLGDEWGCNPVFYSPSSPRLAGALNLREQIRVSGICSWPMTIRSPTAPTSLTSALEGQGHTPPVLWTLHRPTNLRTFLTPACCFSCVSYSAPSWFTPLI